MNKILYIAASNLHKRYGGALATLAYYNAFAQLYGDRVDLALPGECCYGRFVNDIPIPSRGRCSAYFNSLRGHFHRYHDYFADFMKRQVNQYDVVVINGGFYAGDMTKMFQSYGIKVIVIHHNYEPEYHMDNRTLPTFGGLTPFFVVRNERRAYQSADLNAFLTTEDIRLHEMHYGKSKQKPFLLGVFEPEACDSFPGESHQVSKDSRKNIVITGSMNSVQTIKGIMDFKQRYFPILRDKFPDWKVIIAGRNPADCIMQFQAANQEVVSVIPNPKDINEVIAHGSIFLCPTNVGGGLKLRLMDGLRNGLSVLVHQVSARGYELFNEQPFFRVYGNEIQFETGVKQLTGFIDGHINNSPEICKMYRSFFGFDAGCERVKKMMDLLQEEK